MKIAVIGAGNIGGTLGASWEKAGHEVVYGLRDPSKRVGGKPIAGACSDVDVVVLAIPGDAVVPFVHANAKDLDGKTIIDATNNFRGASMNSWSEISSVVPRAQLYRAFNSYGWDVFANPSLGSQQADMFFAGPKGDARDSVERLIEDVGMRPIWVGGSDHAGTVDGVLRLWFDLARVRGRRIALRLIAD